MILHCLKNLAERTVVVYICCLTLWVSKRTGYSFYLLSAFLIRKVFCLNLCKNKNLIQSADRVLEVIVLHTDDDIELAGALVDHLDIDMRMRQGGENTSCSTARGLHAASHDCDKRKARTPVPHDPD